MRIHEQRQFGLAEHVDESRRNDASCGVDALPCRGLVEPPDRGDVSRADTDVRGKPGCAGAVDDPAVLDDQVVGRGVAVSAARSRPQQARDSPMSAAPLRVAACQAFVLSGMTGFTSETATTLEVLRLVV